MTKEDTKERARTRLLGQQIARPRFVTPADLVRWMGAVQAQDYLGALWAVGLRLPRASEKDVEDALARGAIVRTWPMRGTLHLVAAEDVRWMLGLLTPRVIARSAGRYRQLGLDETAFGRARGLLSRALQGGGRLTRHEAYAVLDHGGVATVGQRGIHVLAHLSQQGLLCFGPRQGRQPTFVLLDEWVPATRAHKSGLSREVALATLATRYFASHGPATLHDFAWWSGLPLKDAQGAVHAAGGQLEREMRNGRAWWSAAAPRAGKWRSPLAALLPPWDEHIVAYQDRAGLFTGLPDDDRRLEFAVGKSLILIDGRARGTWSHALTTATVRVSLDFWAPVAAAERRAVLKAAARYGAFLGKEAEIR